MAFGINAHSNEQTTAASATLLFGPDPGRLFVSIKNSGATACEISGDSGVSLGNGHILGSGDHLEISGLAATVGMYTIDNGTHVVVTYLEITQT